MGLFGGLLSDVLGGVSSPVHQGSLAEVVESWVGSGTKLPVSADQIKQALDPDTPE